MPGRVENERLQREQQRKLSELEQKLKYYETVLQLLDTGVHAIDLDHNTMVYNQAMGALEGEDPSNVCGRPLLQVFSHLKEEDSTLLRVLRSGTATPERRQTYINSWGRKVVTVNSNQPLFIDGKLAGALEIAKDITSINAMSEKMLALRESLTHKESGKENGKKNGKATCASVRFTFEDILGRSALLLETLSQARRIANTPSTVLLCGETGTGKELFAQSIHAASPRHDQPFIGVNCAVLPAQLLEAQLFGSVKGAFTDALDRPGLFEQARKGTLFLDEINSMPLELQSKLLRVLQERRFRRLGDTGDLEVNARILASLNADPRNAIRDKQLREDLYYRLSVANLYIPPLRDRPEDIPVYTEFFLRYYAERLSLNVRACSPKVAAAFQHHPWPGNVRQLEHTIEGALNLLAPTEEVLRYEHLPMLFNNERLIHRELARAIVTDPGTPETPETEEAEQTPEQAYREQSPERREAPETGLRRRRAQMELQMIAQALESSQGNISRAAQQMGISRQLLQYKLKRHGLR